MDGMRQAQVDLMRNVPNVIQAATIAPILYWMFDSAVAVERWPDCCQYSSFL